MVGGSKLRSRWAALLMLAASVMVLSGCSVRDAPQTIFAPSGSNSQAIYDVFKPVFGMAIFVFVVVEGMILYSALRNRRRTADGIPLQLHGNTLIELAWTIVPAFIVLFISVLTFRTQALIERPAEQNAVRVEVIGHKWWWEFRYPNNGNVITANELHMPADRDVELFVTSSDVIHSFWVPRLAGKRDAIPNHMNRLVTKPTSAQSMLVRGQCAEFCGKTHAMMGFHVVVQPQAEFDAWVKQEQADAAVPQGVTQAAPKADAGANDVAQAGLSDQVAQATATADVQITPGPSASDSTTGGDGQILRATAEALPERAAPAQATAAAQSTDNLSTPEARGYKLFSDKGCIGCHAIKGYPGATQRVGPDLTHVGSRQYIVAGWLKNDTENLESWLRNPDAIKPGNAMAVQIKRGTLSEDDIHNLRAYLQSLK